MGTEKILYRNSYQIGKNTTSSNFFLTPSVFNGGGEHNKTRRILYEKF